MTAGMILSSVAFNAVLAALHCAYIVQHLSSLTHSLQPLTTLSHRLYQHLLLATVSALFKEWLLLAWELER